MKLALPATALAISCVMTVPSHAQSVTSCGGANCVSVDQNILLTDATNQAFVTGYTNNSNTQVTFSSTGNTLNANNGQSSLSAFDELLENITVMLGGGATFQRAEFNLFPLTGNNPLEASSVVFNYAGGGSSGSYPLSGNGNNWFGITADPNKPLSGFTIITSPTGYGFDSLRQLRFGGISGAVTGAVPEPATWAMLLLGFGAIGSVLRRRKTAVRGKRVRVAYS